jgi:hypothetical protein
MLPALFRVTEGLFALGGFDRHAFTLGFRERMVLDTGQGEGITPLMQCRGHRANQPIFEDPYAPDTALSQILLRRSGKGSGPGLWRDYAARE